MTASLRNASRALSILLAALVLQGCGGGGSGDTCRSIDPSRTGCGAAATGTAASTTGTLQLGLLDAAAPAETATTTITPVRSGTIKLQLKDANGNPVAGVVVTVASTDKTAVLNPLTGSALTDASGVARVGIGAGTQAGGFTAAASATVAGKDVTASIGYTVSFPVLTFSAMTVAPNPLSAGGTASLSVTVLDGGQPFAPAQSVSFTSPCAAAGKASISSPVTTVAGLASTSYIDKGCGAADTITATTTLAGAAASQTASIATLGATAGQLAFISALPQNIALKGTGGPGRQESATVTFKVLDRNGNPVAGAPVDFVLFGVTTNTAGTGGLTLNPASANSGADGQVSTTLFAGIVNTPVRVTASVHASNPLVSSTSDQLVISTGIPDQDSFSLSTRTFNVEGAQFNGCQGGPGSIVTVSLADHFHNPVPDGTAVSFTAEGGVIDASCLTGMASTQLINGAPIQQSGVPGTCTVRFCSASPRAADGRVTIMAYALGEESFQDDPLIQNSINRYDEGEPYMDLCEPFRNDRAINNAEANSTVKDSRASACPKPANGEVYIDTNGDGFYTDRGDGQYNGVLKVDANGQTVASNRLPTVHVRSSLVQVMSGSDAAFTPPAAQSQITLDHCVSGTPFVNKAVDFVIAVRDKNPVTFPANSLPGNILPAGTIIDFIASNGTVISSKQRIVPNTNGTSSDLWTYTVTMRSDATQFNLACSDNGSDGLLTVRVTTPMGVVSESSYRVTD